MTKPLPQLLKDTREKQKLSLRQVSAASGDQISATTLSKIERGRVGEPTRKTLEALSGALGVPMSRLRAAQGQTARMPAQPFVLPPRASDLTIRERRVILQLVDTLIAAHRSAGAR